MVRPPIPLGEYGEISTKKLPNGHYEARVYFRDGTGARREKRARAKTKAAVITLMKKRLKEQHATGGEFNGATKFSVFAEYWLTTLEVRDSTLYTYSSHVRFLNKYLGERRLHEITTQTIESVLKQESIPRQEGRFTRGGPATARNELKVLTGIFKEALRVGAVTNNPAALVRLKRRESKPIRVLTMDEITKLRQNIKEYYEANPARTTKIYLGDSVDFLLATGCRIGEALALRWEDIDLESGFVTIQGTMTRNGFQALTKTGEVRSMRLPSWCVSMLKRRKLRTPPGCEWVFYTGQGTTVDTTNYYLAFRKAVGEEFDWVTTHTFRKTVATMVNDELGAEAAALQLGHEDTAVTKKSYIARKGVSDVADLLERFG